MPALFVCDCVVLALDYTTAWERIPKVKCGLAVASVCMGLAFASQAVFFWEWFTWFMSPLDWLFWAGWSVWHGSEEAYGQWRVTTPPTLYCVDMSSGSVPSKFIAFIYAIVLLVVTGVRLFAHLALAFATLVASYPSCCLMALILGVTIQHFQLFSGEDSDEE